LHKNGEEVGIDGEGRGATGRRAVPGKGDDARPGVDYSPITLQRKPIMMKNPLNIMIKPIPPYGELAPSWGTSWSPIPNTTAQATNRKANTNFVVGRVINRPIPDGPSDDIAARSMIRSIPTVIAVAMPNSTGREKKIVKSCTGALVRLADLPPDASRWPGGLTG
jgi:hypothetical protein